MSEKIKCFLVDDDMDDQEIFQIALTEARGSAMVQFAINGKAAIRELAVAENVPDFIFLDMNMPGMSGRQCLQELKRFPHIKNVPVVIFSTSVDNREVELTKKLGAAECVIKPSSISELAKILTELFNTYCTKKNEVQTMI